MKNEKGEMARAYLMRNIIRPIPPSSTNAPIMRIPPLTLFLPRQGPALARAERGWREGGPARLIGLIGPGGEGSDMNDEISFAS